MIYSKNGNNGIDKKLNLSLIKNDSLNISKNSRDDYIKSIESHPEINLKILSKNSSPVNSSIHKKREISKNLYKSKTLCVISQNDPNMLK